RLQALETLQIRLLGQHSNKDFDPFQFAPQLRSLTLSAGHQNLDQHWSLSKLKLPYSQITCFHWQDNVVNTLVLPPPDYRLLRFALGTLSLLRNVKTCQFDFHAETIAQISVVQSLRSFIEGRLTIKLSHLN
ncbi:hypothetical protein PQX77_008952, partial [Marasmius sp. AFHP31]